MNTYSTAIQQGYMMKEAGIGASLAAAGSWIGQKAVNVAVPVLVATPIAVGLAAGSAHAAATAPTQWDKKEARRLVEYAQLRNIRDSLREQLAELEYAEQRERDANERSLYLG